MKRSPENFLKLLDLFHSYPSPSRIAKKLNISQQALNPLWRDLKKAGVVEKVGLAWILHKDRKLKFFEHTIIDKHNDSFKADTFRGHAYQFTVEIPKNKRLDRDERRRRLKAHKISPDKIWHDTGDRFIYKNWLVKLGDKSLTGFFRKDRSIYGQVAVDILAEALYRFREEIIHPQERILSTKFYFHKEGYRISIGKEHHSLIHNLIARMHRLRKVKLTIEDPRTGKIWMWDDFSHNIDEAEFAQAKAGDSVKRMYNSVKATDMDFYKVLQGFDRIGGMIEQVMLDRKEYAENINAHVQSIKDLGVGVNRLTTLVSQMSPTSIPNDVGSVLDNKEVIERMTPEQKKQIEDSLWQTK